jgi:hypothetical protein
VTLIFDVCLSLSSSVENNLREIEREEKLDRERRETLFLKGLSLYVCLFVPIASFLSTNSILAFVFIN